jgi:hypothetical protein
MQKKKGGKGRDIEGWESRIKERREGLRSFGFEGENLEIW